MPNEDLDVTHSELWQTLHKSFIQQRLAQALLFTSCMQEELLLFAKRITRLLLCKQQTACEECQSCQLMRINEHPDFNQIISEKLYGTIKVDQIRSLQDLAYRQPTLSSNRVIFISSAEKMNQAAANALLKILEEPPDNVYFILTAEQISTIPVTILSRCQRWNLPTPKKSLYLKQAESFKSDSIKGRLYEQLPKFVDELMALQKAKITASSLAASWVSFEFNDLIRLLYLLNAQMIYNYFNGFCQQTPELAKLSELSKQLKPVRLFEQLDKLNAIIRNLNHTLSMNQLLILEDLLIGYM